MRPNQAGLLVAYATDWWAIIFNPSFPYRFVHMMMACFVTVAFLLGGVSAYRWLRGDRTAAVWATLRTAMIMAVLLVPVQIGLGDLHGLNTLQHQPAKIAAMEGIWETQAQAPAVLFAFPDSTARENRFEIAIPCLASLYLKHEWDGVVQGLNDFMGKHPPVAPVFWAFRFMVGVGLMMLAIGLISAWHIRRQHKTGKSIPNWLLRVWVGMSFSGWIATVAGWYVTEMGRQPWLVYGVLTTAQAAAPTPAPMVATTLGMYLTLYVVLIMAYVSVVFYMARKAG